ncbi:MAG TPA: prepilin-type N-terminal cleavage/methylation domain-containing protein [Bacteroidia bacterium]|nr:prepilin-type N-terminal cleavage/methylation domain-containing protein [Bacteroidia bacterium]
MQKLKAFTLMELLIGMIVSAIVISFCYMSYGMIYKQFINYKTVKQELVETMQFHSVLNRDFADAQKVLFKENELTLVNAKNVSYNFETEFVFRQAGEVVDTFFLNPVNISVDYLMTENNLSKPVVQFSFDALVLGEQEHFLFSKRYDAEMIVNNEIQNLQEN